MEYVKIFYIKVFKCEDESDHDITIPTITSLSSSEDEDN